MKNLLVSISPQEVAFFTNIGLTVINCDSSFLNQKPGRGKHWLWFEPTFTTTYQYWGGGEDNPMTGFSLPSSKYTGNFVLPVSAFWFGQGLDYFGANTTRKIVETENPEGMAPLGALDGLRPTSITPEIAERINTHYYEWVRSLLPEGKTRSEAASNVPENWPEGPYYDPFCAVARCNPKIFPFAERGISPQK